jgi:hypothetical protein
MEPDGSLAAPAGRIELTEPPRIQLTRWVELSCFALCVANAVCLATAFVQGHWILNSTGQLLATDFVNVWTAGRLALDGYPAVPYDIALNKEAQVAAIGQSFEGHYPWIYPPTFLFPAAALAAFPYLWAYGIWIVLTFAAYVAVIRGIIGQGVGIMLACAYPGLLSNFMVGQNGFLTAALIGAALLTMPRGPIISGCLLGILAFKPHLGVLIPVALIADGRWNVIGAATTTALTLAALSWLAFGTAPWEAFFHALEGASQATLSEGRGADWFKLQSLYAVVRLLGGSDALAWTTQVSLIVTMAIALYAIWRSRLPFDLKAAALVTATLLATPYIFLYDLVLLAVAMGFLLRAGAQRGFLPGEFAYLGLANLLILVFPVVTAPLGFAAVLVVVAMVARRAFADRHSLPTKSPTCKKKRRET